MPKAKKTKRRYTSFEEFRKAYLPKAENQIADERDPVKAGKELAKRVLKRVRLAMSR